MNIFKEYSKYYDLLYQDKDYIAESEYIHRLIQQNFPDAVKLLDLGCGTGGHAYPLAEKGYSITGVDLSPVSIEIANSKLKTIPGAENKISFQVGDAREIELNESFDVVIALFHVLSYQTSHEDISCMMSTAKKHLKPGGLFIADFWYGPGVLSDPPKTSVKRMENNAIKLTRIAEPEIHSDQNTVDVNYTIFVLDKKSGSITESREKHPMRYFFKPELERYISDSDLRLEGFYKWMTSDHPDLKAWLGIFVSVIKL